MRILTIILIVLCVVLGVLFGALNAGLVGYDFGFARADLPKGASLLTALVLGWLLGGFTAWWGVSAGHRRDRRKRMHETRSKTSGT
jgi:uncharacterized integral membrane protein